MKMKKMRGGDSDEEKVCEDEVFNGGAFAGFAVFRRGGDGGAAVGGDRHWSDWISVVKEIPRKEQNRIKTGQKREAYRSREKFKAVTVERGRKTEQNAKRRAENAYTVKSYSKFKGMKKRKGLKVYFKESYKLKKYQENDKIGSKPDKNEKRIEAEKSLMQLQ
nr:hypothetical protein [Tanacetum cinerariifolium]